MTAPLGVLAIVGRRPLAESELHGEPLWRHALRALAAAVDDRPLVVAEASVVRRLADRAGAATGRWVPVDDWWDEVVRRPRPLLVHDPLCPLTEATFLAEVVAAGEDGGVSAAAYRPVTDTVKIVTGGRIRGTVDREQLAALGSPVYVGGEVVRRAADAGETLPLADPPALVAWLRARGPLTMVRAPSLARRVDDESAIGLLECVDQLGHRLRR